MRGVSPLGVDLQGQAKKRRRRRRRQEEDREEKGGKGGKREAKVRCDENQR